MIKNFLIVAWRNLWKHKLFSIINVCGLAIGLTSSLLILLWIRDEVSVDRFHTQLPQLYSLKSNLDFNGELNTWNHLPYPVVAALKDKYPEVKEACTFSNATELITDKDRAFKEKGLYTTPGFLSMFSFPLIQGNAAQALTSPNSLVITEALAARLYGSQWQQQNLLGRTVTVDQQRTYRITGVCKDAPANATLQFTYLAPFEDHLKLAPWDSIPDNFNNVAYMQLHEQANAQAFNAKLKNAFREVTGNNELKVDIIAQPLKEAYLYGDYKDGKVTGGRIEYVRILAIVAVFLLVIACINFMNLATARSVLRAREIGVRKASGADRRSIFLQFIMESLLMTVIAAFVAILLTNLLLPLFNDLTGKSIRINYMEPASWSGMIAVICFTGLLAGSYPAIVLSGLNPVRILKGSLMPGNNSAMLRKGLVVFQYVLSTILIISTIVIKDQMNYIEHKHLGLDRNNLFCTTLEKGTSERNLLLRSLLLESPAIEAVTFSNNLVINNGSSAGGAKWEGKPEDPSTNLRVSHMAVGYDFVKTMKMSLTEGRDFSPAYGTDSLNFLLNESAVKAMALKHPVGSRFSFAGIEGHVVGVIKDYHFQSMREQIPPLMIYMTLNYNGLLYVRPRPGRTAEALAATEKAFNRLSPGYHFSYTFMDKRFGELYQAESRLGRMADWFASIAVLISCLGLFGLATFTIQQRTREIGVRKVLGASVGNVTALLSKDFIKLVFIAVLIACPIAWLISRRWLQDFAYRIHVQWWVFAVTAMLVLLIAFITVCLQSVKAALMNPAKSLRTE